MLSISLGRAISLFCIRHIRVDHEHVTGMSPPASQDCMGTYVLGDAERRDPGRSSLSCSLIYRFSARAAAGSSGTDGSMGYRPSQAAVNQRGQRSHRPHFALLERRIDAGGLAPGGDMGT